MLRGEPIDRFYLAMLDFEKPIESVVRRCNVSSALSLRRARGLASLPVNGEPRKRSFSVYLHEPGARLKAPASDNTQGERLI